MGSTFLALFPLQYLPNFLVAMIITNCVFLFLRPEKVWIFHQCFTQPVVRLVIKKKKKENHPMPFFLPNWFSAIIFLLLFTLCYLQAVLKIFVQVYSCYLGENWSGRSFIGHAWNGTHKKWLCIFFGWTHQYFMFFKYIFF